MPGGAGVAGTTSTASSSADSGTVASSTAPGPRPGAGPETWRRLASGLASSSVERERLGAPLTGSSGAEVGVGSCDACCCCCCWVCSGAPAVACAAAGAAVGRAGVGVVATSVRPRLYCCSYLSAAMK